MLYKTEIDYQLSIFQKHRRSKSDNNREHCIPHLNTKKPPFREAFALVSTLSVCQHSRYARLPDSFASKTVRDKTKLASFYRLEPNAYRYWNCPNEFVAVAAVFSECVRLASLDSSTIIRYKTAAVCCALETDSERAVA